jgi:hypothetical protein
MKEDIDTLKNDWLTDNVWHGRKAEETGLKYGAEHSILGRVCCTSS